MKKLLSLLLAAVLTAAVALPALAAVAPAQPVTLTVNGKSVDTSKLPAVDGVPLRAMVEADGGSATWYPEERSGLFFLDGTGVSVDFVTGKATVGYDREFTGCTVVSGVTFVPMEVVAAMEGVKVTKTATGYAVTTPSSDPMVVLTRDIVEQADLAAGMKAGADYLSAYGVDSDVFEQVTGYTPMMIRADTVLVGKVKSGKLSQAKEGLEACRQRTIQNFENYLPSPLEMAKNGKVVTNGDYVMLIISGDNDKAVELFNAFVKAQK